MGGKGTREFLLLNRTYYLGRMYKSVKSIRVMLQVGFMVAWGTVQGRIFNVLSPTDPFRVRFAHHQVEANESFDKKQIIRRQKK